MNTKKISISIITILLLINIILVPKTFAMSDIIGQGKGFLEKGEGGDEVINATTLGEINSEIYNVLLVCGIGVAVIVGAILGITFILSSAEGKAKISETLVPYIVGCFVVFGAFTIWKIVVNIGNSVESSIEVEEVEEQTKTTEDVMYEISDKNKQIEEGKINLMTISEEELKSIYRSNRIDENLKQNVIGDSRGGGGYTLEEAVDNLGETNKKIWQACYDRELLKDDRIWLKDDEI